MLIWWGEVASVAIPVLTFNDQSRPKINAKLNCKSKVNFKQNKKIKKKKEYVKEANGLLPI